MKSARTPATLGSLSRPLRYLRARFRHDDFWISAAAALLGLICGVSVSAFDWIVKHVQLLAFGLGMGEVSGAGRIPLDRIWVPAAGGAALGVTIWLGARLRRYIQTVDPIEANATTGGRIPLPGAIWIMLQTILSHGSGASVGMEGAHTQMCSALGSRAGQWASGRRMDMRLMVACGAGASIAAIFQSPIAGAFYAFELVVAAYSIANLAPVAIAALVAAGTRALLRPAPLNFPTSGFTLLPETVLVALSITILTSFMAIGVMRACTWLEAGVSRRLPGWLSPMLGGVALGALALASPAALSSGRTALQGLYGQEVLWLSVLGILVLKAVAVTLSVGTGFRGGLSFASLFLGLLCGKLVAALLQMVGGTALSPELCELVGMTAFSTAIIGAPLAMAFLVSFASQDMSNVIPMVCVATVANLLVRRYFGYSFATWRFHLRGDPIRSGADMSFLSNLKVGEMMRRDATPVLYSTDLAQFRKRYPPGSRYRVVVTDHDGIYLGVLSVPELHNPASDGKEIEDLLRHRDEYLTPEMTAPEALKRFTAIGTDALAVIDRDSRKALGVLMEPYVLRRCAELSEQRMREIFEERGAHGPAGKAVKRGG